MSKHYLFMKETASTNLVMKELLRTTDLPEGFVVRTDFQTMGKGQGTNVWESEKGKNLLFSLLLRPTHLPVGEQFLIAQIVSLGILKALNNILSKQQNNKNLSDVFTVKWPNDIYWGSKKIGGMLIENVWKGSNIETSIVGVGLNVNQKVFHSDAPNPVSLLQILGKNTSRKILLQQILDDVMRYYKHVLKEDIRMEYAQQLFRRKGYFTFKDAMGVFEASICGVKIDGELLLADTEGEISNYYFKEVEFVL